MSEKKSDPYNKLDAGAPHMNDDDYRKMGLGSAQQASAVCPPAREAENDDDRQLRDKIENRLRDPGGLDMTKIRVSVVHGSVRLEGISEHRFARTRAEQLTREMEGVSSVDNHISVQPTSANTGEPVLTTRMPGVRKGSTRL
jgi:osmotically-inducible protein OsmY